MVGNRAIQPWSYDHRSLLYPISKDQHTPQTNRGSHDVSK